MAITHSSTNANTTPPSLTVPIRDDLEVNLKQPNKASKINSSKNDQLNKHDALHIFEDDVKNDEKQGGNSTFAQATFNCTSLLLGLGILSSPYAIAQAGWLGGGGIALLVAGTYAYTALLMVRCMQQTGAGTYQELASKAVGRRFRLVIEAFFYMDILGSLVGYCISIADNLHQIFPDPSLSHVLPGLSAQNLLLVCATLCILPTVWLRDLSALAFTSVWSLLSTVVLLLAVIFSATVDAHVGLHHSIPVLGIHGAPVAAGLYAFAFGGSTVFPSICQSMKDPSRFPLVLVFSFGISIAFTCGLGFAGASMFGKNVASQITLSMPAHHITTKMVLWMTVTTPMLMFALLMSPVSKAMDIKITQYMKTYSPRVQLTTTTMVRSVILTLIVISAMALPYFNYVIALIGSSLTIVICLIFPCIFYFILCRDRITKLSIVMMGFVCTFAIVAAVCGTIVSFQGLVESRRNNTS